MVNIDGVYPKRKDEFKYSSNNEEGASNKSDNEVNSPLIENLFDTIVSLSSSLHRTKDKNKWLKNKLKELVIISNTSYGFKIKELEIENASLRSQLNDLKISLEKFTQGLKYLNIIINS